MPAGYGCVNARRAQSRSVAPDHRWTAHLIIQGTLHTRLHRLTDVLNEPDAEHLVLFDATFMEVGSRRVIAGPSVAQIQLADLLFAHVEGPTESETEMRMPKQAVRTVLLAPPFTLRADPSTL